MRHRDADPNSNPLRSLRHAFALLLITAAALAAPAAARANPVSCDRWASPFGSDSAQGTQALPYHSVQRLADMLAPGQTGCLVSGTYSDVVVGEYVLRFGHGGAPGAPITIRSAPGNRATLRGIVYVPEYSDHVTLSDLNIDARKLVPDHTTGIQVTAADTVIQDSDITNQRASICMVLGSPGWGQAVRTVIQRNVFHECGGTANMLEHSIYIEWTVGVLVTDNEFLRTGAYAIHFYPDAHQNTVTHNVMVGGRGGVIFAGEADAASTDNVVSQNIITGTTNRPGIHSWWGGVRGYNNQANSNCLDDNPQSNVDVSAGGFTAANNLIANPGFANPAADDYRLAANSPCLALVGYDTAAKLQGQPPGGTPTPTPTPSPTATATATPTATPTPTPTATAPPAQPTPTATPSATPTPNPTPTATAPPATPTPTPTPPAEPPLPDGQGTGPQPPDQPPIEAARYEIDAAAFSASGGSSRPAGCARHPRRPRCRR
ncbi:MAG: hypothetical protein QOI80_1882 [Solirubrobacteraceae bacterium]|jgi:hypothetical protein|nr:hypothetical protein [Solirubrobacteraceae bacterium]